MSAILIVRNVYMQCSLTWLCSIRIARHDYVQVLFLEIMFNVQSWVAIRHEHWTCTGFKQLCSVFVNRHAYTCSGSMLIIDINKSSQITLFLKKIAFYYFHLLLKPYSENSTKSLRYMKNTRPNYSCSTYFYQIFLKNMKNIFSKTSGRGDVQRFVQSEEIL